jgi:SagB-type dehydrogenase family enzyme
VSIAPVEYHDATKHQFSRFARSSGYLDWATQPDPFRRYAGAPLMPLRREPLARDVPYDALFDGSVPAAPVDARSIGELLRCALGLSAWKQFQATRWPLRVNPSSGNLHPTEAYVVWRGIVSHYAPREHALEQRAALDADPSPADGLLVALTSVFWREAWKYGERAFRYCQHDVGHALGALRLAAALVGWRAMLLPQWSDAQVAALTGIDRDDDVRGAEREHAECLVAITPDSPDAWLASDPAPWIAAARRATWQGRANTLSPGHVEWPIIDEVATATAYPGAATSPHSRTPAPSHLRTPAPSHRRTFAPSHLPARQLLLQRRSAVAFDPGGRLPVDRFLGMLQRLHPGPPPWDAIDWPPQVHLAMFVHRIDGLTPGVYAFVRDPDQVPVLRAAMRKEFLWEPIAGDRVDGLYFLLPYDITWPAARVSCDQDIAGDGFFSLGMLARFDASLRERGPSFYRRLFWECGLIGQVLYLEAEAAGARSTGIGCFYDDPVHDMLGLSGHAWQSLYHFSMGIPIEDERLTTERGYPEEF